MTAGRAGKATIIASSLSRVFPAAPPASAGVVRTRRHVGVLVIALGLLCIPLGRAAAENDTDYRREARALLGRGVATTAP